LPSENLEKYPVKILLLSNKVPFPANDGSTIAIRSMIDAMLLNGVSLTVLSLNTKKHHRSTADIKENCPANLDFTSVDVDTDLKIGSAFLNLLNGQPYHVSRFKQMKMEKILKAKLKEINFDIIQLEGLSMAVYLPLIRKYSQASVLMRAHNIEHQIWQRHTDNESKKLKKKYLEIQTARLKKFEIEKLEQMDAQIFISDADRNIYRKWGGKRISCSISCGLNPEEYVQSSATEVRYDIAHLASLDWLPNQQGLQWFLDKVWPLVLEARPETRIAIGGRHMPKKIYQHANDRLWVFSEVDNIQRFIKSAKIAIIPLLAGSGMRIKLIEYMAMGQACVSTEIGAEGISLEANKEVFLANDPEGFASAIILLLDNEEERISVGTAARAKFIHEYSNAHLGSKLIKFYQTLL
jgi:glycosyltransferase involved in cell wall biosynthesis